MSGFERCNSHGGRRDRRGGVNVGNSAFHEGWGAGKKTTRGGREKHAYFLNVEHGMVNGSRILASQRVESRGKTGRPGPALPGRAEQVDGKGGAGKVSHTQGLFRAGRARGQAVRWVHTDKHGPEPRGLQATSTRHCRIV